MTSIEQCAYHAKDILTAAGTDAFAITASEARSVEVEWRIGDLERLQDKTHNSLGVEIYVDGKYAGFSTNDLRHDAVAAFLNRAVEMTRFLEPDACRSLPNCPVNLPEMDLDLFDACSQTRSAADRKTDITRLNDALTRAIGATEYASFSVSATDGWGDYLRLFSNGFQERLRTSSFGRSGTLSLKDDDGKLPLGWDGTYARHQIDLVDDETLAKQIVQRAQHQLQASSVPTNRYDIIIVNRVMGKVLGPLLRPLSGASIQQGRSMWKDRLNERVISPKLTISDDPHVLRGLGSGQFDGDGFQTRKRPIIESGVLKTFFINHYYAQKMGCKRTGGDTHNLKWHLGEHDLSGLVSSVNNGLLIERFLGGNCNETTGNFSFGCAGRRIENGEITTAFSEANLSGNIEGFWNQLAMLGNDPLPQSTNGAPSCIFEGAQISGS